jgi:hypothetical protein
VRETLDGLEVNAERMRANLDAAVAAYLDEGLGAADAFVDRALARYGGAA